MHGGAARDRLAQENPEALMAGSANLSRHIENVRSYGMPLVVAINRFSTDTQSELDLLRRRRLRQSGSAWTLPPTSTASREGVRPGLADAGRG